MPCQNQHLILPIFDYGNLTENDGVILFLNFFKAFESLEHQFVLLSHQHFGFRKKFIDTISLFSQASGLKLNTNKCELMTIYDSIETHI